VGPAAIFARNAVEPQSKGTMFRSEKPTASAMTKPVEPISPGKINSIMEGTSIVGEIQSDSNIRIDGKIKGTLTARGRVIVGQNGVIEGEVVCQSADIEGTVLGKVNCQDLLSLKATAKLHGDINTKKLAIEPGAVFTGNCSMAGGVVKEMDPARLRTDGAARPEPAQAAR
jgi:cytoskeletal protein CcmA (bactofilin family)